MSSRTKHDESSDATNRTRVWRASALDETLFLRAEFKKLSFDPHYHDEYAIGVIDGGCQAFNYDRTLAVASIAISTRHMAGGGEFVDVFENQNTLAIAHA